MEGTPRIEQVRAQDLEAALALLTRFFREHGFTACGGDLRSPLEAMITDPSSAVFLCTAGGEYLGVVTVTYSVGLEYGRSAEIEDLYVIPEARRSGIGSLLVKRALDWCRAAGCSAALVTIAARGAEADLLSGFYQRHGFELTPRRLMEFGL